MQFSLISSVVTLMLAAQTAAAPTAEAADASLEPRTLGLLWGWLNYGYGSCNALDYVWTNNKCYSPYKDCKQNQLGYWVNQKCLDIEGYCKYRNGWLWDVYCFKDKKAYDCVSQGGRYSISGQCYTPPDMCKYRQGSYNNGKCSVDMGDCQSGEDLYG